MDRPTPSYILIKRETAVALRRAAEHIAHLYADAGPNWSRQEQAMRLAEAELRDAIAMSQRATDAAAARKAAAA